MARLGLAIHEFLSARSCITGKLVDPKASLGMPEFRPDRPDAPRTAIGLWDEFCVRPFTQVDGGAKLSASSMRRR
jgi:hypothetical protein